MEKVLFVANVYKFLNFEKNDMKILSNMGYEIHSATNMQEAGWLRDDGSLDDMDIQKHHIDFSRNPLSIQNYIAYKQLKKLIEENNYSLVHVHTQVGAAIGRIAARKARKDGTKVVYTDHGFNFHKSSSRREWLFYPVEKFLSRITDMIISINKENFDLIQKFPVKFKRYIPGIGIDYENINNRNVDAKSMRKEIGIPDNAFVLLSIAELRPLKNQRIVFDAMLELNDANIYYILCGTGESEQEYRNYVKEHGLENKVIFLGYREHDWVMDLCHCVDVGMIPSKQEGLGLAGLEMMSAGKPLIGSCVQGIADYLVDNVTGIKANPYKTDEYVEAISRLKRDKKLYSKLSVASSKKAQEFDISITEMSMKKNYCDILGK